MRSIRLMRECLSALGSLHDLSVKSSKMLRGIGPLDYEKVLTDMIPDLESRNKESDSFSRVIPVI